METKKEHIDYRLGLSRHKYKTGQVVVIVENPIDAILIEQTTDWLAVATLGVTVWKEEWTQALKANSPHLVVIVYDNDIAGNTTNDDFRSHWLEKNPKAQQAPMPNGMRLSNTLNAAGVKAMVYRWPNNTPEKSDVGQFVDSIQIPV